MKKEEETIRNNAWKTIETYTKDLEKAVKNWDTIEAIELATLIKWRLQTIEEQVKLGYGAGKK